MRFGLVVFLLISLEMGGGCATRGATTVQIPGQPTSVPFAGVWEGTVRETVTEGLAAGDSREEQQEWHLAQAGHAVSGYYLATLTYTSGDGRPYLCNRAPRFSALVRIEVSGRTRGDSIDLNEIALHAAPGGRCTADTRPLARYRATVTGDVLTLVSASTELKLRRETAGRGLGARDAASRITLAGAAPRVPTMPNPETGDEGGAFAARRGQPGRSGEGARASTGGGSASNPADVSGVWIWEHRGSVPTGAEKQEREEWHVDQRGDLISGYYDRIVREVSTDGHAYKCSQGLEFEIATRYRIRGQVNGNQVLIIESSYEVLDPSACDNGQRRLDAYEGLASGDEVRLAWGVGAQILRRPRPDVPTQHF